MKKMLSFGLNCPRPFLCSSFSPKSGAAKVPLCTERIDRIEWNLIEQMGGATLRNIQIQLLDTQFFSLLLDPYYIILISSQLCPCKCLAMTCTAMFSHNLDLDDTNEDFHPFLEAIGYFCDASDAFSLDQEDAVQDSLYAKSEICSLDSPYQHGHHGFNSWRNWDGEYDSCFAFTPYMDDSSFSSHTGGHVDESQKTEDWFKNEEHTNNYYSAESSVFTEDCLWSGYESWFKYEMEDDSYYCARQRPSTSCNMDELGVCEGILGYWPCLTRNSMTCSEQNV